MSEMVERVKAAMQQHVGHDNWVDDWDKVARAAIAAMREYLLGECGAAPEYIFETMKDALK